MTGPVDILPMISTMPVNMMGRLQSVSEYFTASCQPDYDDDKAECFRPFGPRHVEVCSSLAFRLRDSIDHISV